MLRHLPACAVLLLILASACSSGDGADTTPTGSSVVDADTNSTSSPVTAEAKEGESPLEGEWFDANANKMLVVRGDIAEFFQSRGPFSFDTDADPNQITLPSEDGELTTIFRLDGGQLQLVMMDPTAPLPESIEAAAGEPERYFVLELFRGDVMFASGVWRPAGYGLPPLYDVVDMTASGDTLIVGSITSVQTLFISTDKGASWSQVGGGFPAEEGVWALTTLEGRVFAGTHGQGVFISDDGGETWTASSEGLAAPGAECRGDSGAPHSQIGDIAGFGSTVFVSNFCGVWRSDNLGESWREVDEGFVANPNVGITMAVEDGVAYASTREGGVFRLDWERDRWEPIGHEVGFATAMVESEGALLLSSPSSGVWRSDDLSESWTDVTDRRFNGVWDLAVVDSNIFAATPQGVFWTEDTGDTWTPYNKDLVQHVSLLQVSGDRLFAAGRRGVFSAPFPDQLPSQETATVIPGEVPEGFEAFDGSANGFTIALPATWLTIDLTVGDKDSIAAELETIFPPESANMLSSNYFQNRKTAASSHGTVMVAFDPTGDPSLIVTVSPRGSADTLESEEARYRSGIEASGGSVQSIDRLELSGRAASRIVTLLPFETNDVELVLYLIIGDDTTYNISFNISEPEATETLLSQIINTFTLANA